MLAVTRLRLSFLFGWLLFWWFKFHATHRTFASPPPDQSHRFSSGTPNVDLQILDQSLMQSAVSSVVAMEKHRRALTKVQKTLQLQDDVFLMEEIKSTNKRLCAIQKFFSRVSAEISDLDNRWKKMASCPENLTKVLGLHSLHLECVHERRHQFDAEALADHFAKLSKYSGTVAVEHLVTAIINMVVASFDAPLDTAAQQKYCKTRREVNKIFDGVGALNEEDYKAIVDAVCHLKRCEAKFSITAFCSQLEGEIQNYHMILEVMSKLSEEKRKQEFVTCGADSLWMTWLPALRVFSKLARRFNYLLQNIDKIHDLNNHHMYLDLVPQPLLQLTEANPLPARQSDACSTFD
eukprot:TRINITY_DN40486_c0_g1_i1.p1 TRINITY_DN40486_c0_g1~~TRINITY_DN40486_c0_g1_i1.p1  ORF type:complete len:350 (-),score=48.29 TRINITY_DN40486_c0_g1_i1:69-1118(-)